MDLARKRAIWSALRTIGSFRGSRAWGCVQELGLADVTPWKKTQAQTI
jgi:hypothetical protein